MKQKINALYIIALALGDMFMVVVSYIIAYWLRFYTDWLPAYDNFQPLSLWTGLILTQAFLTPVVFLLNNLYRIQRSGSRIDEFFLICVSASINVLITVALIALGTREFGYSRLTVLLAWFIIIVLTTLTRVLQGDARAWLRRRGIPRENMLIVGTNEVGRLIAERVINNPELGYHAAGFLSDGTDPANPEQVEGVPVLGILEDAQRVVHERKIDEVIVTTANLPHTQILALVNALDHEKVNIKVYPDLFHIMATQVTISDLQGMPLVSVRDVALRGWKAAVKRGMDLAIGMMLMIVVSPALLIIAALLKISSPNEPVLFIQERVGLDGKSFPMIKFRSMRSTAEKHGPGWTVQNDPRRTWIGSLLRKHSFDEWPQFINVLLGDMSIVGPRPEQPYFVAQFSQRIPRYMERHREKSGITGWAQVNGLRGDTPIEDRTAYDLWYIENWTIWLDIKIMLRTIRVMLEGKAY